jgi:hypothetical protein
MQKDFNRRQFFSLVALITAVPAASGADAVGDPNPETRRSAALQLREKAALAESAQQLPIQSPNGDETALPRWTGAFTKGLPHDQSGEVEPGAYETLLAALASGKHADFESVARGSGRKLKNPQAAFAYELEGGDSRQFACPAPPRFNSPEGATEMVELYWQALLRDVPFTDYSSSPLVRQAAAELGVSPETVFRGPTSADNLGPYVSQFLWKPVPYGSGHLEQRYRTPVPGIDFVASYSEWLQIQTGVPPWREYVFDATPRYIRNGRDLAEWVHYDFLFQAFLNAALILLNQNPDTVLNKNPNSCPNSPYKQSKVQEGFVTFGCGDIVGCLGRVTAAALKAAWFQKWLVHRRLRPEEFGGRVHQTKSGTVRYPAVPGILLNCAAVQEAFRRNGTYLLPQAYPEGSPIHPAYPSGHATVSGACATILKAFFDENELLPDCVMASADGLSLMPCHDFAPTVGQEINKLAFNIPMGRNWSGIHYRSDAMAGLRLGEDVAISLLQDLVRTYTEAFPGFSFTRFDGTPVIITGDPQLQSPVATGLTLSQSSISAGLPYTADFSGPNLTHQTFFDVRFRAPGSSVDQEALNWQFGQSATHIVPAGTPLGSWTFTGVRAHQEQGDTTGSFNPVTAVLTVLGL